MLKPGTNKKGRIAATFAQFKKQVEDTGIEPVTSNMPCLRSTR